MLCDGGVRELVVDRAFLIVRVFCAMKTHIGVEPSRMECLSHTASGRATRKNRGGRLTIILDASFSRALWYNSDIATWLYQDVTSIRSRAARQKRLVSK